MSEKDFLISVLQLIEVSLQRGAIRSAELEVITVLKQYVAENLQKYNESVPAQDSIEPESTDLEMDKSEDKKDKK